MYLEIRKKKWTLDNDLLESNMGTQHAFISQTYVL